MSFSPRSVISNDSDTQFRRRRYSSIVSNYSMPDNLRLSVQQDLEDILKSRQAYKTQVDAIYQANQHIVRECEEQRSGVNAEHEQLMAQYDAQVSGLQAVIAE